LRAGSAVVVSEIAALGLVVLTQGPLGDFSRSVFVIDAVFCSVAIAASRFAERAILRAVELARQQDQRRVLIVGAGRTGRSLLRELRETPGERVVGFVDDAQSLRGRRLNGIKVVASTSALSWALERTRPDIVLVTIPDAPREKLDAILNACTARDVTCRFVQRDVDVDPSVVLAPDRA
jgi:FlaA1/EpsC-like NDP-sugar epimerase